MDGISQLQYGEPIARMLNGKGMLELRRMANCARCAKEHRKPHVTRDAAIASQKEGQD